MVRRNWVLAITSLCIYGLLCLVGGIFVGDMAYHPQRKLFSANGISIRSPGVSLAGYSDNVALNTSDGLRLQAWLIRPNKPNGDAVILFHGLSDNRLGMTGYATLLLARGYAVLMPDARGHGASGGNLVTYGLLERNDIHDWVDRLERNEHPGCVFGFGESMGAAQLLQSLSVESRFCAVAAESSFSNFQEIAYDRVGQFFHTAPWLGRTLLRPLVEVAFSYGKRRYGYDLKQVSPEQAASCSKTPILLIHGKNDGNIPLRHSLRIQAGNPEIMLWEVENTDHCGAISTHPEEFKLRLLDWFASHNTRN